MFDKCYSYNKDSLAKCKTRYLWVLDKHCDYSHFDFYVGTSTLGEATSDMRLTSQWQKDSGTYLVPKAGFTETKYNTDNPVVRLPDARSMGQHGHSDFDYSMAPRSSRASVHIPIWHATSKDRRPALYGRGSNRRKVCRRHNINSTCSSSAEQY